MDKVQIASKVSLQVNNGETRTIVDLSDTTANPEDVASGAWYFSREGMLTQGQSQSEELPKKKGENSLYIYGNATYKAEDYGLEEKGWTLVAVAVPGAPDLTPTNAASADLRKGQTALSKYGYIEGQIPDYPETGDGAIIQAPFDGSEAAEEQCTILETKSPTGEILYTQQHYVEKNLLIKPTLKPVDVILKANEDQIIPIPEEAAGISEVRVPGVSAYEITIDATNKAIPQNAEVNKFISKVTVNPPKSGGFIFNPTTPEELEAGFDVEPTNGNYYFNKATMAAIGEDKINILKIFPDRFDESALEDEDGKYLLHLPADKDLWYFNEARIYNIPEKYVVLDKTEPLNITVNKNDIDVSQYYKVNVDVPLNYEETELEYTPNQNTQSWETYTNTSTQKNVCAKSVVVNPVPLYTDATQTNDYLYVPGEQKGLGKADIIMPKDAETIVEVYKKPHTHIKIINNPLAGTSKTVENHEFATADQILQGYVAWSAEQKREGGIQTYQRATKDIGDVANGDVKTINFSNPAGIMLDINKQYSSGDIKIIPSLTEYEIDYPMDTEGDKNIRKDQMTWTIDDLNEILGEEHVGPSSITVKLPINYQIVQDQLEINTEGEHFVGQYESVLVKLPANKPSEIASEDLMDEKLRTSETGAVFKYTGVTGKYEQGQYYMVEEFLGG